MILNKIKIRKSLKLSDFLMGREREDSNERKT